MNPRVSRSSALASKATGFPIAKFAAKLAVGYSLDELRNDITKATPACFEPTIDYVVTKIPRFAFEKFPEADSTLGYQMKSVGEVMAIGRTFRESWQKALRGLEIGANGFGPQKPEDVGLPAQKAKLLESCIRPYSHRMFQLRLALQAGCTIDELYQATGIDPWFLGHLQAIVDQEAFARTSDPKQLSTEQWRSIKSDGFSDKQLGVIWGLSEGEVRDLRWQAKVHPVYKLVDTCAAEFEAITPYYYSTYEEECEARVSDRRKIMILGGGPNRIGQGIEFDCCCCHAAFALRDAGFETIMVNSNPETVSTDYDTSDSLFFEPLTVEDVLEINRVMNPEGVIVQFGGQTPLNISLELEAANVPIIGTSPTNINRAGDRELFKDALEQLKLLQPSNGIARNPEEAVQEADRVGYPVVVRPSHVLGGRAMEIVFTRKDLEYYMEHAVTASPDAPVLIDKFLENATEVDVDVLFDGERLVIGGMLEHIEEAGIHSGDSACVIPAYSLSDRLLDRMREIAEALARALDVRGLMNVQFAVRHEEVYLIEVNPRASRTVPFISKATGLPLAKIAALIQAGFSLDQLGVEEQCEPDFFSVKEVVFPFNRFPGVDTILGPEMRSTGEVMGIAPSFGEAFYKSQMGAGSTIPFDGKVFISVRDNDKRLIISLAAELADMGYQLLGTGGTAEILNRNGITCEQLSKIQDGGNTVLEHLDQLAFVINTPNNRGARTDEGRIRSACAMRGIPCITTLASAGCLMISLRKARHEGYQVRSLQSMLPGGGVWAPAEGCAIAG